LSIAAEDKFFIMDLITLMDKTMGITLGGAGRANVPPILLYLRIVFFSYQVEEGQIKLE